MGVKYEWKHESGSVRAPWRLYSEKAEGGISILGVRVAIGGKIHAIYGTDCAVPCSMGTTMEGNPRHILAYDGLTKEDREAIGHNATGSFPDGVNGWGKGKLRHCRVDSKRMSLWTPRRLTSALTY